MAGKRLASYCADCNAAWARVNRPKHRELSPAAKARANARAQSRNALIEGKLARAPCKVCGDSQAEMHHHDYAKPLEVTWLCRAHHLAHHRNRK